ncbi:putative immunoglobulin-blocking virulence protein [Mycoplasmopsis meleagridis]|uniref:putative immunoglobulin-blocking virulence protein n=1 Tax=Mycoplasmopsis meleagridis TaxID=29561 RepID=UPI003A8A19A2
MIKAKKIKLVLYLGAVSTVAVASGITAKVIIDNSSIRAKDIGIITASRGSDSTIKVGNYEFRDDYASNKDNNLKKIVEVKPKEEPKVEPTPSPTPKEPEPEEKHEEPKPDPEPEQPTPPKEETKPEETTPAPAPEPEPEPKPEEKQPEPENPTPEPVPEPEENTPTSTEEENNNTSSNTDSEGESVELVDPVYGDVDNTPPKVEEPKVDIINPPEVVNPPKPKEEPKPEPKPTPKPETKPKPVVTDKISTTPGTEGTVNIDSIPDLDFSHLKPDPVPGKIDAATKAQITRKVDAAAELFINQKAHWTEDDYKKLNDTLNYLIKLNPNRTNEKDKDFRYLGKFAENNGKSAEEKRKEIGFVSNFNLDTNYPLALKTFWEQVKRDLPEMLDKGMILSPEWGFDAFSWTFIDDSKNVVKRHNIELNKKRFFGYDSQYKRMPNDIKNNNYVGYSKKDVTYQFTSLGISKSDGISVLHYTPNSDYSKKNGKERNIAVLDATNTSGYNKFLKFLQDAEKQNKKIDGIIIQNMGLIDKKQDFSKILEQLPSSIQNLTLFFQTHDTSSLIGLRNKTIQQVDIYSIGNTIDEDWAIDPYALRGVKYITFDYNYQYDDFYNGNKDVAGSIVFNKLKFNKQDTFSQINEGLKIAFKDRSDERIFQGAFGDGSWPTWLDFSEHPEIRSLEGMNFYGRVFKNLTLWNNSNVFTVDAKKLNKQQWSALLIKGPERPKLNFVSPVEVDTLYIKGQPGDLGDNWGPELYALTEAGKNVFTKVIVDNEQMANVLNSSQAFTTFNKHAEVGTVSSSTSSGGGDADFSAN